jgi:hypothetical protein
MAAVVASGKIEMTLVVEDWVAEEVVPEPTSTPGRERRARPKQILNKRTLMLVEAIPSKTTPSGRARVLEKSRNSSGAPNLLPIPVVTTSRRQVILRLAMHTLVTLALPVLRKSHVRNVVYTIMLLRIAVDCFVRFVVLITTP